MLHLQGKQQDVLPAELMRTWPMARANDLQPQLPAVLAACLLPARDYVGPELVHRRGLHAELPARADAANADEVAEQEGSPLSLRQGEGPGQALLLPDGYLSDPARRPLRLP